MGRVAVVLMGFVTVACSAKESTKVVVATRDDAGLVQDATRTVDADLTLRQSLEQLEPVEPPPPALARKHRRGDCKAAYAPRPTRDPNPMCRVKGGTFMMGGHIDAALAPVFSSSDVPIQVRVGDFDIDQFEVTALQAAHFLNAHGNDCPTADRPCVVIVGKYIESAVISEAAGRYIVTPGSELDPPLFSLEGAMRYCAWVGKQVPTSAVWEYAARHDPVSGKDLRYPWGDSWVARNASCVPKRTCSSSSDDVGYNDGTRGRGDGSSPWGMHDAIDKGHERVVACDDPLLTCEVGVPCTCRSLNSVSGQDDRDALVTFARLDIPSSAVRCLRRR
jgi:formylglycine-generating enzyme required for sulfatase activity